MCQARSDFPDNVFFMASNTPCPKCMELYAQGKLCHDAVMPLPEGAMAPTSRRTNEKICFDCAATEATMDAGSNHPEFSAARVVIGNERREGLRMPEGMMQHFGLRTMGWRCIKLCSNDDLEAYYGWLKEIGVITEENVVDTE